MWSVCLLCVAGLCRTEISDWFQTEVQIPLLLVHGFNALQILVLFVQRHRYQERKR